MLTYSALLSISVLLFAHFVFKEYRYSLYFIISLTWVTFFTFDYAHLRICLFTLFLLGYGYLASVYGWPADSWHGPPEFELYKIQKYIIVYSLGFSWGIMMKYQKSLVNIIRNFICLYFLFLIPFFCMEDDDLRKPNLDLNSPKDFVSRLIIVTRTICLMFLYVAIVSSSQIDIHDISLGLKIWDLFAFCTHLI